MSLDLYQTPYKIFVSYFFSDPLQVRSDNFIGSGVSTLVIQRNTELYQSVMFELDQTETSKCLDPDIRAGAIEKVGPIFGVIGIMFINGEEFLCTINKIEEVAIAWNKKDKHGIYLVKDVKFLPIMDPSHAAK